METARTIAEAKAAFLRNQVQILTAPISPQEGWRDYGPETEDDISDKVVEEVLQKGMTRRQKGARRRSRSNANSERSTTTTQPGSLLDAGHSSCRAAN